MKNLTARYTALVAFVAGMCMATSAHAYWNLDTTSSTVTGTGTGEGSVTMSGFYVSNTTGSNGKLSNKWSSGTLTDFSGNGQGMYSGTDNGSPYHALDNNQNTEAVLLSFANATALTSIGLGYTATTGVAEYGCKTTATGAITVSASSNCGTGKTNVGQTVDLSVFRWVGSGTPTGTNALTNTVAGTMSGWELVGNYGDMILDTSNPYNLINSAGKTSSYWLITAYNSAFTQSSGTENRSTLTDGDDYFKLYAVAGTTCSTTLTNGTCNPPRAGVPEPASLALTSVALLGMFGLRRRKAA